MGASTDDIFRILIATDNHLGYAEKDPERSNDSFETFEEILAVAVEKEVDFILLGGDLFHENKPSRQCVIRCMDLLRRYTFGDRPVVFNFVSDPAENFKHAKNPTVNYLDPNLNVAIPVFSIHGNHDDPSGLGQMCALEMLSTAGLLNYFGRNTDLKNVTLTPILLEKGRTKLALYGLSSIKDERLFRLFRENRVKMLRPREDLDSWFNILTVHQNRTRHGPTSYLLESFLDPFLNLVVWGHEHQCLIEPKLSAEDSFHVLQPGSSVATSLCAAEADKKQVALLEVNHMQQFKITSIPLKTVRPFVFEDLCLEDHDLDKEEARKVNEAVEAVAERQVRAMITTAREMLTGHARQPTKPLIRLRIEYKYEYQMFNVTRFGHRFEGEVANPGDIVLFRKARPEFKRGGDKVGEQGVDGEAMDALFAEDVSEVRVEDLVQQYFSSLELQMQQLYLLSEKGMAGAVRSFVDKDDKDAIAVIVQHQMDKTRKYLLGLDCDLADESGGDLVEEAVVEYRMARLARQDGVKEEEEETQAALDNPKRVLKRGSAAKGGGDFDAFSDGDGGDNDDDDDDMDIVSKRPARGRGSRGGRGRAARGAGRGSTSKAELTLAGDGSPKASASGRGGRGSRGRGRAQAKNQSSIMESFQRAATRKPPAKKNICFISDSDDD